MSTLRKPVDLERLRGTIAVVTGAANKGIGWGICVHAATQLGMHIVIIDLHQNLVEQAAEELRQLCPEVRVLGLAADVTQPEQMAEALACIRSEFQGIGIGAVFANAGVIFYGTILKSSLAEWATTMNVNVIGVVNTVQTFLPILIDQSAPSLVVATASVGGLARGDGGGGSYQASKHAVVAMTESLSFELASKHPHIHVHVLCPCIVASALPATSKTNFQAEAGEIERASISTPEVSKFSLAMTPTRHAQQVFDQIERGNFYILTDNVRPYVDHDKPFNGMALVEERMRNLLDLTIDNSDAFGERKPATAILKGPMFQPEGSQSEA